MLVSAEEQGDLLSSADLRDDARGEHAFAAWASELLCRRLRPASQEHPARRRSASRRVSSPFRQNLLQDPSSVESSTGSSTRSSVNACRSIIARILTVVSSLYNTSPWAAWRTSSSSNRFGALGLGLDDVPLGRGRQGNAQALLQRFIAIQGHPRPISQQRRSCCRRSRHTSPRPHPAASRV